jgi:hypothetical protein
MPIFLTPKGDHGQHHLKSAEELLEESDASRIFAFLFSTKDDEKEAQTKIKVFFIFSCICCKFLNLHPFQHFVQNFIPNSMRDLSDEDVGAIEQEIFELTMLLLGCPMTKRKPLNFEAFKDDEVIKNVNILDFVFEIKFDLRHK